MSMYSAPMYSDRKQKTRPLKNPPTPRFQLFSVIINLTKFGVDKPFLLSGEIGARLPNHDNYPLFTRHESEPLTVLNKAHISLSHSSFPLSTQFFIYADLTASGMDDDDCDFKYRIKHPPNDPRGLLSRDSIDTLLIPFPEGCIQLSYCIISDPVDASVEMTFHPDYDVRGKLFNVKIYAYYGGDPYDSRIQLIHKRSKLSQDDDVCFLKNRKIPLKTSFLAVPANGSLKIRALIRDLSTGFLIMNTLYEFHAKRKGSSKGRVKEAAYCSLEVDVNWKCEAATEENDGAEIQTSKHDEELKTGDDLDQSLIQNDEEEHIETEDPLKVTDDDHGQSQQVTGDIGDEPEQETVEDKEPLKNPTPTTLVEIDDNDGEEWFKSLIAGCTLVEEIKDGILIQKYFDKTSEADEEKTMHQRPHEPVEAPAKRLKSSDDLTLDVEKENSKSRPTPRFQLFSARIHLDKHWENKQYILFGDIKVYNPHGLACDEDMWLPPGESVRGPVDGWLLSGHHCDVSHLFCRGYDKPVHMLHENRIYFVTHPSIPVYTFLHIIVDLYAKGTDDDDKDIFQLCNGPGDFNLPVQKYDTFCGHKIKLHDGTLDLVYIILTDPIDAVLDITFKSQSDYVCGNHFSVNLYAFYGDDFGRDDSVNYGLQCHQSLLLADVVTLSDNCKITLNTSSFAVPAKGTLKIRASIYDKREGEMWMENLCEFIPKRKGGSSNGCMTGPHCSLEVNVNWKYEAATEDYVGHEIQTLKDDEEMETGEELDHAEFQNAGEHVNLQTETEVLHF